MIGQLEAANVSDKNAKFHEARAALLDLLPRVVRRDLTLKEAT